MSDTFLVQFNTNLLPPCFASFKSTLTILRISGTLMNCPLCLLKESHDLRNKKFIQVRQVQTKKEPSKVSKDPHKESKENICHFYIKKGQYQKDFKKCKSWFKIKVHLVLLYVPN